MRTNKTSGEKIISISLAVYRKGDMELTALHQLTIYWNQPQTVESKRPKYAL